MGNVQVVQECGCVVLSFWKLKVSFLILLVLSSRFPVLPGAC